MWDSLGEIAQSLLDIAFSLFGFNIDLGNMGLTAKEFCDWNTITASEFGTLAEILNSAFVSLGLNLLTKFVMIDKKKKAMGMRLRCVLPLSQQSTGALTGR